MLTLDALKEALPLHLKTAASQSLVDKFNLFTNDPDEAQIYRDNLTSYMTVLKDGKFKVEDYMSAVVYCSHKLMGNTNQDAYRKTFPQRYQNMVARGFSAKEVSSYVANYNNNKLVNLIMEQSLVPTWVLNADIYQKAINTQFEIMTDTQISPKVRAEAANSILTHLKRPETKKVEIDLGVKDNSGLTELRGMMEALVGSQLQAISEGINTQTIAHQPLVLKDVTPGSEDDGEE